MNFLNHFPAEKNQVRHHASDYSIIFVGFYAVTLCLISNSNAVVVIENVWGAIGFVCLAILLHGENTHVRIQVIIAMTFATVGEFFASTYMEGYIYHSGNIPAYVPPGHGMVYLTAVAFGRSGLFQRNARFIAALTILIGGIWAIWGLSDLSPRYDVTGFILYIIFVLCIIKGKNPMVYLGAFYITSWLEIVGTVNGNWVWASIDPASGLSQGNPPSGVAAYYCLVDAVAIGLTPIVSYYLNLLRLRAFTLIGRSSQKVQNDKEY